MKVVGLDLSLTALGYCDPDGLTETLSSKRREMERIADLRGAVMDRLAQLPLSTLVMIEDYAFSRGGHAHELGELGGVIKHTLRHHGHTYVLIGPSALKKFATSKGNANKIQMGVAAAKAGEDFNGDDNQCDAWWLWAMAHYRFETDANRLAQHAYRDEVVGKIVWPKLGEQACTSG